MSQNEAEILGQKYGDYAGFTTESSPISVNHFGEDPLNEVKRLLHIYVRPNSRILDIGCGAGQTLCQFAPQVQEAWGIDGAGDLLAGVRERVRSLGLTNVTLVEGNAENIQDVAQLPDHYFDVAYTESGPNMTEHLVRKLTREAYFLQEILGRVPYTNYAYHNWDQSRIIPAADLGLLPVSIKNYFWEVYFRIIKLLKAFDSFITCKC